MMGRYDSDNTYFSPEDQFKAFVIIAIIYACYTYWSNPIVRLGSILVVVLPIIWGINKILSYKNSISLVDERFVTAKNSIKNDQCTVIYTEGQKIVIIDNYATKLHPQRMFTITQKQLNVNKTWNSICKVFESCTDYDYLMTFYGNDANSETVILKTEPEDYKKSKMNIQRNVKGPTYVEMNNIQADSFSKGTNVQNVAGAAFVNMNSIPEKEASVEKQDYKEVFTNMSDIVVDSSVSKVDVNNASAENLASLPGINIILAKKIIDYRNKNGLFKSAEDFIKVSQVKPHFIDKVKSMIIVGNVINSEDDHFEGRIIDF